MKADDDKSLKIAAVEETAMAGALPLESTMEAPCSDKRNVSSTTENTEQLSSSWRSMMSPDGCRREGGGSKRHSNNSCPLSSLYFTDDDEDDQDSETEDLEEARRRALMSSACINKVMEPTSDAPLPTFQRKSALWHHDPVERDESAGPANDSVYLNARRRAVEHVVGGDENGSVSGELLPIATSTSGSPVSKSDKVSHLHRQDDQGAANAKHNQQKHIRSHEKRLVSPLSKASHIEQGSWTMETVEPSSLRVTSSREWKVQLSPEIEELLVDEDKAREPMRASSEPGAVRVRPSSSRDAGAEDDEEQSDEEEAYDPTSPAPPEMSGRRRSTVLSSVLRGVNRRSLIQAFVVDPEHEGSRWQDGSDDSDNDNKVLAQAEPLNTRAQVYRRRVVACLLIAGLLGMTVSLAVTLSKDRRDRSPAPSLTPTSYPSGSPSYSSDGLLTFLSERSWDGGAALRERGSPQYEAADWILSHAGGELIASYSQERVLQRYIMACLYFGLGGGSWLHNSNWIDPQVDECSWFLESANPCNEKGELTDIVLRQNFLRGKLPLEFTLLPAIKVFDLSSNDITGTIPTEIGSMPTIEALVVGSNRLTGAMPKEFTFMPTLRLLDISNNMLGCPEPWTVQPNSTMNAIVEADLPGVEALGNQLVVIDFEDNPLTTPPGFGCIVPHATGLLTNLQKLDIKGTPFIGTVPPELGALVQARLISFPDQFTMTGIVPTEIAGLLSLVSLDMTRTFRLDTRRPIPTIIGYLTSLGELRAASIAFDGTIPTELGMLSNSLQLLDISNSSIHGEIPTQFGRLTALTELHLGETALSGTLPTELGLLGDRLRHLDLHGKEQVSMEFVSNTTVAGAKLDGSLPLELASLTRLTHMDLSFTDLSGEWPTELNRQQLPRLHVLRLESTMLVGSITNLVCNASKNGELLVKEISIGNTLLECECCPPDSFNKGFIAR